MVINNASTDNTDTLIIINNCDKGISDTIFIYGASIAIIDGIIIILITVITELEMDIITLYKQLILNLKHLVYDYGYFINI